MTAEMVAQVRRFNRTVTQRIGVLNENFLASDRSLGQNRLLWEIGVDGCDIRSLRERLDLDSGYLSRLLRALEAGGFVVVEPSPTDGRIRIARLTTAGRRELAALDQRSRRRRRGDPATAQRPAAHQTGHGHGRSGTPADRLHGRGPRVRSAPPRRPVLPADLLLRARRPVPRWLRSRGQPGRRRRNDAARRAFARRIAARRARRLWGADLLSRRRRPGEADVGGTLGPRAGAGPPPALRARGPGARQGCRG